MKPIVIYHGNCADGFAAAWSIWNRFGDLFEYYPGIYQQNPPDVTGRVVIMVDFSYKKDVLLEMIKTAESILVIDHHKSAYDDLVLGTMDNNIFYNHELDNFSITLYLDSPMRRGYIHTYFDMERSGAGLAWDIFNSEKPRPKLINYVEDRDLWRFKLDRSKVVNSYIFAHEYTFTEWNTLCFDIEYKLADVIRSGEAIEKKFMKDLKELLKVTTTVGEIGGYGVKVANLPYIYSSEGGNLLASDINFDGQFASTYYINSDGEYVYSLRSIGDFDVSAIAKEYGGGGHKNAAGFKADGAVHE